jgi:dihydroorotate dehydrogenase
VPAPGRLGLALYRCARPALFGLDPERAHHLALAQLSLLQRAGLTRALVPRIADDPVTVMGLRFPNPVGLAAGLDKNAACGDALGALGFGFLELGTVTPKPQQGNPRPRLFRLVDENALINRFGFNNAGIDAFIDNVRRIRFDGVIGLNLGKNAATPNEQALDDYAAGLRAVHPLVAAAGGYVAINVSSPNTRDLRALQGSEQLTALLGGLAQARSRLADDSGARVPLAVKIGPDLDDDAIRRIADALVEFGIDAVIATNTTIDRAKVAGSRYATEAGGLSGAPLRARATAVIRTLATHLQQRLPIIGVGGIASGADAVEKLGAGATMVQLYTGLIFRGPGLIAECREAIRAWRARSSTD